jgi:hypothetical protein
MEFEKGFEIYGVRVAVASSDRDVFDRLVALIPPGTPPCDPAAATRFGVMSVGDDAWQVVAPAITTPALSDIALAVSMLDTALRDHVIEHARDKVFIRAGAVAYCGRAILVPGRSFSGKTTLVAALVRAGAEYYSDELAVLDEHGLVHPYARPLAVRVGDLNGPPPRRSAGAEPVPVALVAATDYRPGATFAPERRSAAQGMLLLMEYAAQGPANEKSQQAMSAIRQAVTGAQVLEGRRGDADEAAAAFLELVAQSSPGERP